MYARIFGRCEYIVYDAHTKDSDITIPVALLEQCVIRKNNKSFALVLDKQKNNKKNPFLWRNSLPFVVKYKSPCPCFQRNVSKFTQNVVCCYFSNLNLVVYGQIYSLHAIRIIQLFSESNVQITKMCRSYIVTCL